LFGGSYSNVHKDIIRGRVWFVNIRECV
jgi:hypothetical protein